MSDLIEAAKLAEEGKPAKLISLMKDRIEALEAQHEMDYAVMAGDAALINGLKNDVKELEAQVEGLRGRFDKDQDRIACQAEQLAALKAQAQPVACKHEWFRTGAMEYGECRCIKCGVWNKIAPPPRGEMKHTPEPWQYHNDEVMDSEERVIAHILTSQYCMDEFVAIDARRIVACVNALAHISTEILESGEMQNLIMQKRIAEEQRDELARIMEMTYKMLLSEPDTKGALFKAENLLREALAEVKEKP